MWEAGPRPLERNGRTAAIWMGEIDALNRIVDMTVPLFPLGFQEDRTYLVPGHGYVCDFNDLVEYGAW